MDTHRSVTRTLLGVSVLGATAILFQTLLITKPMIAEDRTASSPSPLATATLGGGCFWCLEAAYERFQGVDTVVSGYAGGHLAKPTYEQVCGGDTGHAEVVQIRFDPKTISFEQILEIFWSIHDPTTPNRQGPDVGSQYRSIILYENAEQKRLAEKSMRAVASDFPDPLVTELVELKAFYPAEEHHQDFYARNPGTPYCRVVISPKLQKLEKIDLPKKPRASD